MKILQVAYGVFFLTYGGVQVYVKNIVDVMILQGENAIVILSLIVSSPFRRIVLRFNRL